ncbi:MAG: hypothetical protein V7K50_24065 [Nostoc sp.]
MTMEFLPNFEEVNIQKYLELIDPALTAKIVNEVIDSGCKKVNRL